MFDPILMKTCLFTYHSHRNQLIIAICNLCTTSIVLLRRVHQGAAGRYAPHPMRLQGGAVRALGRRRDGRAGGTWRYAPPPHGRGCLAGATWLDAHSSKSGKQVKAGRAASTDSAEQGVLGERDAPTMLVKMTESHTHISLSYTSQIDFSIYFKFLKIIHRENTK